MPVFHRGWMKYILSDRGDCGGVSVMRGDSGKGDCGWGDCGWGDCGWLPGHTGGGIPVGEPSGRTETQAGVARIKDIIITVLSCRE